MEETRPSERDMMGGLERPDLRCEEHGRLSEQIRRLLIWFQELDERVKSLEELP